MEDAEVLTGIKNGDEQAFAGIYDRYWEVLYATAYKILQNHPGAQDAVQNVFISLWQRRADADITSLKAYLQQATRFQVFKAIREKKTDAEFYTRLAHVTATLVYEQPLLFKEQKELLARIFHSLPDDCRTVFRLSREEELTYKQIAARLNISEKTVEKKMSICLKQIRQALRQNTALAVALMVTHHLYTLHEPASLLLA